MPLVANAALPRTDVKPDANCSPIATPALSTARQPEPENGPCSAGECGKKEATVSVMLPTVFFTASTVPEMPSMKP